MLCLRLFCACVRVYAIACAGVCVCVYMCMSVFECVFVHACIFVWRTICVWQTFDPHQLFARERPSALHGLRRSWIHVTMKENTNIDKKFAIVAFVIAGIVMLLSTVGNSFIIVVTAAFKNRRLSGDWVIMVMALINLFITNFILPNSLHWTFLTEHVHFSNENKQLECIVWLCVCATVLQVRCTCRECICYIV